MDDLVCFVISPIGNEGTEIYEKFKEVLDHIIKPAFNDSGYTYKVIRADDINKPGSFIIDILEHIHSAYIVIADLTDQNPNVFYELGVRHSLSPRTILIAQSVADIPSDLRQYRTIIYRNTSSGVTKFKKDIKSFLDEIHANPEHRDNPVLQTLLSLSNRSSAKSRIEEKEEPGLLDYRIDLEEGVEQLIFIIQTIAYGLNNLTNFITANVDLNSSTSVRKQRNAFIELARYMDEFRELVTLNNHKYEEQLDLINKSLTAMFSGEYEVNNEAKAEIESFIHAMKNTESQSFEARQAIDEIVTVMERMPRIEKHFNSSKKGLTPELKKYRENIDKTCDILSKAQKEAKDLITL